VEGGREGEEGEEGGGGGAREGARGVGGLHKPGGWKERRWGRRQGGRFAIEIAEDNGEGGLIVTKIYNLKG